MQGRPAESKQQIEKRNWVRIIITIFLDVSLVIVTFYAGYLYGGVVFQDECPSMELVKSCYVNTNVGILTNEEYDELTKDIGADVNLDTGGIFNVSNG